MIKGTGNSVAEYKTEWVTCELCGGDKKVELEEVIIYNRVEGLSRDEALDVYREWKRSGDCPACGGRGGREVWS